MSVWSFHLVEFEVYSKWYLAVPKVTQFGQLPALLCSWSVLGASCKSQTFLCRRALGRLYPSNHSEPSHWHALYARLFSMRARDKGKRELARGGHSVYDCFVGRKFSPGMILPLFGIIDIKAFREL